MKLQEILGKTTGKIVESKLREEIRVKRSMYRALKDGRHKGIRIIAELKTSSPSEGNLRSVEKKDVVHIIQEFEAGGASAISVMIEPICFNGSIEYLKIARDVTDLPLLAKGFLFSPMHLIECMAAGADAYLLMIKVLEAVGKDIKQFIDVGNELGMEAFIEVSTAEEIQKALALKSKIIEVNNRNIYGDLDINLNNVTIGKGIPKEIAFISASGIENGEDIKEVYELSGNRADAVLVGTCLMKSRSISRKARELVTAGEEAVA